MEINIKRATISDTSNLAVLKQQVWISTYAVDGLIEEFSNYVLSEYSIENVRKSIVDPNKLTLIAVRQQCVIGCVEILLFPKSPMNLMEPSIEISSFYILEKFQGFGVGKKLLEICSKKIKQLNYNSIWLTVYHKNHKAIEFYKRQKFIDIGETEFILGTDKHKNFIMLKKI